MVLDLKFCRFENIPWGFRLTGGTDFEMPLTVIKVTEGSIAENAGLKVGDVVVRINDTPMSNLNHKQSHEVIMQYGSSFVMGVIRPDNDVATEELSDKIANGEPCNLHVGENEFQQIQTPDSQAYSAMSEMSISTNKTDESRSDDANPDIVEEKIAELMSGEAEVLKEHNVLGVNFQRIMPKSGLFKSSEVFKHLNAEATKTKAEKEQEIKRWTTFLQKPNRPIPKSKEDLEYERKKAEGYKVIICKQPKPKCAPNRTPTPEVPPTPEPVQKVEPQVVTEPIIEQLPKPEQLNDNPPTNGTVEDKEVIADSEVPNLEQDESVKLEIEQKITQDIVPSSQDIVEEKNNETIVSEEKIANSISPKSEEEMLIEKQLADVQQQLLALSSLPLTIQATLDAVTKQLADLVPVLKIQKNELSEMENGKVEKIVEEENVKVEQESVEITSTTVETVEEQKIQESTHFEEQIIETVNENIVKENKSLNENTLQVEKTEIINSTAMQTENHTNQVAEVKIEKTPEPELTQEEIIEKQKCEKVFRKQEEEWVNKREKYKFKVQFQIIDSNTKYKLSTLIDIEHWNKIWSWTDQAKGSMFKRIRESNCPLIDRKFLEQINFSKYKKPEKDLSNLKSSEVFKIIHHLEKEPKHGIQVRPPKVLAEEDVLNRVTPISCL